jgi:secondary thiamine-phosphate synthase enzyme
MKIANNKFQYSSQKRFDFIDITDEVKKFVDQCQIKNGLVNIQTLHTTTAIIVNENEPLLLEDIKDSLEKIAPSDKEYRHDNFEKRTVNLCSDECANGHSHCKAVYLPFSATLNLIEGKIQFGSWQRVFLLELDRPRKRTIQIQIIGE